jgi:hypothetical protein
MSAYSDIFKDHLTPVDGTTYLENVKNHSPDAVSYLTELSALKTWHSKG